MIESLACGTPVIAMRHGSVPEVIEHGRTGFIVETADEMFEAARHIDEIDPAECRRAVEERFGSDRVRRRSRGRLHQAARRRGGGGHGGAPSG